MMSVAIPQAQIPTFAYRKKSEHPPKRMLALMLQVKNVAILKQSCPGRS